MLYKPLLQIRESLSLLSVIREKRKIQTKLADWTVNNYALVKQKLIYFCISAVYGSEHFKHSGSATRSLMWT